MQRTIFHLPGLGRRPRRVGARLRLTETTKPKLVALMASTEEHCLIDLLWRNRRGELDMPW